MYQPPLEISRKEKVLFDLFCCVNELLDLKSELSKSELTQMSEGFKKLGMTLFENQTHYCPIYLFNG